MSTLFRKKKIEDIIASCETGENSLKKGSLSTRDLTALGIAAIIGGGIFSTIGEVASSGGPAVSLLFIFTAIACGFSGLCYSVFASKIPISGSAYTYAYASFGELFAWIIGWDLILEYAIGNIAVAISWSDYFTGLMLGLGVHIPEYFSVDYWSASHGISNEAIAAWNTAPELFGIKLIGDIPAFFIVIVISWLVYRGIRESKNAGNLMVLLKLIILMIVIGVGAFYVNPENWSPFAPNGLGGVLKGVGGVFFAYIGFDAISTTAEECKKPEKDLPKAMIYSLLISTVLYVLISLVLTGMVHYSELEGGDPLAKVFQLLKFRYLPGIISVGAIFAMASVLLVFQVGQPRIWMSMSRDGLLPPRFSKIHKKFKTPSFSTIVTGTMVAIPSLFLNIREVTDLTSIGTLFAFILVCGGVLVLEGRKPQQKKVISEKGFRLPYFNSRYVLPFVWTGIILFVLKYNPEILSRIVSIPETGLNFDFFLTVGFITGAIVLSVFAVIRQFSAIPVLGLITNFFLMSELTTATWIRFMVWLAAGLVIYFSFGRKNSKLNGIGTK